ncbi:MAG: aldehyde dehydrogenase family protein, partial [Bacteroidota bacterium]
DVDAAVEGAILSKYRNAGQTCVCTNRFLIHANILDAFNEKLAYEVNKMKVGDGFLDDTQIGPLINEAAIKKVNYLLNDAIEKGAKIFYSRNTSVDNTVISPIILTQVTPDMALSKEEIFGPISAISSFS